MSGRGMDYSARSAMAGFNRAAGVPRTHYAEAAMRRVRMPLRARLVASCRETGRPAGSATEVTASSPSTLPVARVRADA
jgi:hypothetical protein